MKPSKPVVNWGLLCAPCIKWLISSERQLYDQIALFIEDKAPDIFDVIGPPTLMEIWRAREKAKHRDPGDPLDITLPSVTLRFKKERTVEGPAVRVSASDDDLVLIESWQIQAQSKPLFDAAGVPTEIH